MIINTNGISYTFKNVFYFTNLGNHALRINLVCFQLNRDTNAEEYITVKFTKLKIVISISFEPRKM